MQAKPQLVVGIAGRIGSGKSELAQTLRVEFGFKYLRYSLVLADWFNSDPNAKQRLQEVGWQVMSGYGQVELNRRLIERVEATNHYVIDGLRHPIDLEMLKARFSAAFGLIFVDTPSLTRFNRLRSRFSTYDEFLAADSHLVEGRIEELKFNAVATISGTLDKPSQISELRRVIVGLHQRLHAQKVSACRLVY